MCLGLPPSAEGLKRTVPPPRRKGPCIPAAFGLESAAHWLLAPARWLAARLACQPLRSRWLAPDHQSFYRSTHPIGPVPREDSRTPYITHAKEKLLTALLPFLLYLWKQPQRCSALQGEGKQDSPLDRQLPSWRRCQGHFRRIQPDARHTPWFMTPPTLVNQMHQSSSALHEKDSLFYGSFID